MKALSAGGGFAAIRYSIRMGKKAGYWRLWRAMSSRNACKTCALGMGGQLGGMRNEAGHFPEFCKKSLQAMVGDMQGSISEEFFAKTPIASLRQLNSQQCESLGRLAFPIIKTADSPYYRRLSWEDALAMTASHARSASPDSMFFYASGRSSNEAAFLLQLLARQLGTNNVNNCSYYCHQASGVALQDALGSGTATLSLADLAKSDFVMVLGGNPASNHPRLITALADVRKRGGSVIAVNPARELGLVRFRIPSRVVSLFFGSNISSMYLQPHIGGDIALMVGIIKELLQANSCDPDFLANHATGWDEIAAYCRGTSWDDIVAESGLKKDEICAAAAAYARSKAAIFAWTMGITHHLHGVANIRWIVNLAAARGMIGKPGAGLLPIRGHSNVQGIGTMGFTPKLKASVVKGLAARGVTINSEQVGLDTMACMEAASGGDMRFAFCLGGNLYGSNPDSRFAQAAFEKIPFVVYLSTTMNTGHFAGLGQTTIVLPVSARDEEEQRTTQESMFNYVRVSDGGTARQAGTRTETAIVCDLARQVVPANGAIDWQAMSDHDAIRDLAAQVVPGLEELGEAGRSGREFEIPGRVFHQPRFNTEDGRVRLGNLHGLGKARNDRSAFPLRLMTVRSEGQFNTVVYEEEDIYRGQERRDVILMSQDDMDKMRLKRDDRVVVSSVIGQIGPVYVRPFTIRAGNVLMYYPEANAIVPRTVDALSRTPAFKAVDVAIRAVNMQ